MIRLKKLYSEPTTFDSVTFEPGINIILGEKSKGSDKTNGVGKSVSIEFLNFCLLKKAEYSRVLLIPNNVVDSETVINLDLTIHHNDITISRKIGTPDVVTIFQNGSEINFDKLEDASDFLGNLYFEKYPTHSSRISFRNLLAPIIRDEKSEFKDIIKCFDTDKNIPRDFKPHLFFLGLSISLYSEIKKIIEDLAAKTKYLTETKKILTNNNEIKVADAKARLNDLESEVVKINSSIEKLKNNESFEIVQNDLVALEVSLKKLRTKQKAIKYEIKQINSLPQPEKISEKEITILFNQFKNGLGDMVGKALNEVKEFRKKIDGFRSTLVNKKLEELKEELFSINRNIRKMDDEYSEKLSQLDTGAILSDLKTSMNVYNKKNQELNNLRALIERYDKAETEKKNLKTSKDNQISAYDNLILEAKDSIKDFEQTILDIHEKIIGNRKSHFEIDTINKAQRKEFLYFDLRTDDDGSWSNERLKVFIYDIALLFNEFTSQKHPSFLVHDNIFNFDNDSIEKCLNYLYQQETNRPEEFQYILTLNRDMVEIIEERKLLDFNVEDYRRATYTKDNRFLKQKYTEKKKNG
ncbi:MAG: DUF2326 domain-containing protein [bacterium]|nr:DUF2326 domain-containing protein [bacterium]